MSNRIYYVDTQYNSPGETQDLLAAGYTSPGWYFWDETDAYCYGPFETENIAYEEFNKYAEFLNMGKKIL